MCVSLRGHNSDAESARELFTHSEDSARLLVCNEKNFFGLGFWISVSDVKSERLLGHFCPLHLALGPNC